MKLKIAKIVEHGDVLQMKPILFTKVQMNIFVHHGLSGGFVCVNLIFIILEDGEATFVISAAGWLLLWY